MNDMKEIELKIKKLPKHLREELESFLDFLLEKKMPRSSTSKESQKILKQDWGGALEEYSEQYTSSELQKKALEWRDS